eukprot:snap_masked-scaffold_11-processed-gene-4.15-mRNA-1 protein AED:1.00 eAED:1.00 QI:0/0/0/0/1/1/2/0/68
MGFDVYQLFKLIAQNKIYVQFISIRCFNPRTGVKKEGYRIRIHRAFMSCMLYLYGIKGAILFTWDAKG